MQIEQAVILCGGLGSRLGDLTADTPKPLLPVAGEPFLQALVREITRYGVRRFLLLAAYRSEQIERFAREVPAALGQDITVEVAIEPDRAGTGGALFHAREALDEVFYLFNGDTLLDTPLHELARLLDDPEAIGALALRRLPEAGRYGVTTLDGDRVTRFGAKGSGPGPVLINGGVAAFRKTFVDHLTANGSFEADALPGLAEAGRLRGLAVDGYFLDIGVPEDFARAQTEIPAFQRRPALFLDRDGVMNLDHGHVGSIDRFDWVEGAREAVALANARGFYVFIVTNQAGIGKGLYTVEDYQSVMDHLQAGVMQAGGWIDDIRFCPDHPEAVIEAHRKVSDWRKPAPGMLLDLIDKWPVDVADSLIIGDNASDIEAARAAGVRGVLFTGGRLDDLVREQLGAGHEQNEGSEP
ncbi:MAG: HAD-IIIA family hydrolase [Brevundimonas sp.]|uniref:HAD-IIIA family hydrolase n=1 Tax=Brevundimonas sp. TaxID=1871086 RepID=UPI00403496E6